MKISHVKKITDDVVEEYIEIECDQIGYTQPVPLGRLSLSTALELVRELDKKLSNIPL